MSHLRFLNIIILKIWQQEYSQVKIEFKVSYCLLCQNKTNYYVFYRIVNNYLSNLFCFTLYIRKPDC